MVVLLKWAVNVTWVDEDSNPQNISSSIEIYARDADEAYEMAEQLVKSGRRVYCNKYKVASVTPFYDGLKAWPYTPLILSDSCVDHIQQYISTFEFQRQSVDLAPDLNREV